MNVLNASNTDRFNYEHQGFVDYVFNFYHSNPYYCSQGKYYHMWEIERAVKRFYKNIKDFDSIDRENIKIIIEAYRQLKDIKDTCSTPNNFLVCKAVWQSMAYDNSKLRELI